VHKRVVLLAAALVLLLVVGGVAAWRMLSPGSTYHQAMGTLPKGTLRATYTDWASVRDTARGTSLGAGSSRRQVQAFLNRAYEQDLTATSAIADSTFALMSRFGFSPLDARWEALGQAREGQVDVLRLDDDVDLGGVERALRTLGYTAPAGGADDGGTWVGGADLVASIDPDLTPVQQNVVVLPDQHLVLMSDNAAYAAVAAKTARGDAASVLDVAGVPALVDIADQPATAVLWASTFACEDLSMGQASEEDQRVGTQLVGEAGDIAPLSGLVMAQQASHEIRVGMHFETSDQASENLQPRVDLAAGDAPGQGGSFRDRFTVSDGEADGNEVSMTLRPRPDAAGVLSDISTGPVLFATC
jgi:hypothetical protein